LAALSPTPSPCIRRTLGFSETGAAGGPAFSKRGLGADFADFPCDFQNVTFCGSDPGNIAGSYIYNWPISQWATRVKVRLDGFGYYQVGVYDQNEQYLSYTNKLLPVFYSGSTGVLIPVEIAWLPAFRGGRLPGSYKVGAWYSSSTANDTVLDINGNAVSVTGEPALARQGRYGGYLTFLQQVTRTFTENPSGGLSVFVNAVFADAATTVTDHQVAAGMLYTGPFSFRPNDVVAVAVGTTHVSDRVASDQALQNALELGPVAVKNSEYVVELDYTIAPTPGLLIRPNVQYIYSPGGSAQTKDIWVFGLTTVITF
jgi:porin